MLPATPARTPRSIASSDATATGSRSPAIVMERNPRNTAPSSFNVFFDAGTSSVPDTVTARSPVLEAGTAHVDHSLRFIKTVGIGLFIKRMRRNGVRCTFAQRVRRFDRKRVTAEGDNQRIISPDGTRAQRAAFRNLGGMQGQSFRESVHDRVRCENRGVAAASGKDHIRTRLKRGDDRFRSELRHGIAETSNHGGVKLRRTPAGVNPLNAIC